MAADNPPALVALADRARLTLKAIPASQVDERRVAEIHNDCAAMLRGCNRATAVKVLCALVLSVEQALTCDPIEALRTH